MRQFLRTPAAGATVAGNARCDLCCELFERLVKLTVLSARTPAKARRLIAEHGFTIVAVEADWPDAAAVDRYVRHRAAPSGITDAAFSRFPPGCGGTRDVKEFVVWMRRYNEDASPHRRAGFYGLDLYNMRLPLAHP
jgi:erythromycin esterase-like protein